MNRLTRTIGLASALGIVAVLGAASPTSAGMHKRSCAPAPKTGCGFSLKMPKLFHGCGPKMPKIGHRHKAPACGSPVPTHVAPAAVMPSAPVPSYQGGFMQGGYAPPAMPMPTAPGMMRPGLSAPGMGSPPMPGMIPPFM
jgi:hypothetical protein